MGASPLTGSWIPEPQVARQQTDRILSSDLFRESPILQRLLRYLVEQALAGETTSLKEYTIGSSVFQRGDDFDPRTDSIVRVQVGVLRKKLAAYYEGPGGGDNILIEVPRGHYAPHFQLRSVPVPTATCHEPVRIAEPPLRIEKSKPAGNWIPPIFYMGAGLVIGIVAFYFLDQSRNNDVNPVAGMKVSRRSAGNHFEWRDHPVWRGFFEPNSSTKLVIGVPLVVGVGGVLIRDTLVNRPEDVANSKLLHRLEAEQGVKGTAQEVYTGLGEAAGISLLTRFFHGASQDLPLIRNRLTKWQDLTAGHAIFLASLRFRTLGQELSRPSDFEFVAPDREPTAIQNRRPQAGEAAMYRTSMNGGNGYDYALVTVWPGTSAGRRIMAIGGSYTWGTEGAVEYITDGPSLRELKEKIGEASGSNAGKTSLQVLLKVEIKDNQVVSTDYVTHHWLR